MCNLLNPSRFSFICCFKPANLIADWVRYIHECFFCCSFQFWRCQVCRCELIPAVIEMSVVKCHLFPINWYHICFISRLLWVCCALVLLFALRSHALPSAWLVRSCWHPFANKHHHMCSSTFHHWLKKSSIRKTALRPSYPNIITEWTASWLTTKHSLSRFVPPQFWSCLWLAQKQYACVVACTCAEPWPLPSTVPVHIVMVAAMTSWTLLTQISNYHGDPASSFCNNFFIPLCTMIVKVLLRMLQQWTTGDVWHLFQTPEDIWYSGLQHCSQHWLPSPIPSVTMLVKNLHF